MLTACMCSFRRSERSGSEYGIAITRAPGLHDLTTIIDSNGNPVMDAVWSFDLHPSYGCFVWFCE